MVKEKIPCPSGGMSCSSSCPVCHGRGEVRQWTMVLEIDLAPGEARQRLDALKGLPVGLAVEGCQGKYNRFTLVVVALRYHLSEAMRVAADYFSVAGRSPLCRKAW